MRPSIAGQMLFGYAAPRKPPGPKRTKESGVPHGSRPELKNGNVAHVTIKLKEGLPSLRMGKALQVVLAAIERVNQGEWIRIVHFSVQSNHVHLIVEAKNSADLSRGMASLNTGLGMRLNRLWNRVGEGSVFMERFHLVLVTSPPQMRNVLNYVLRNDVRHGLNLRTLDPCSSALSFTGWKQLQNSKRQQQEAAARCVSAQPQTWLLQSGWQLVKGQYKLLSTAKGPKVQKRPPGPVLEA